MFFWLCGQSILYTILRKSGSLQFELDKKKRHKKFHFRKRNEETMMQLVSLNLWEPAWEYLKKIIMAQNKIIHAVTDFDIVDIPCVLEFYFTTI